MIPLVQALPGAMNFLSPKLFDAKVSLDKSVERTVNSIVSGGVRTGCPHFEYIYVALRHKLCYTCAPGCEKRTQTLKGAKVEKTINQTHKKTFSSFLRDKFVNLKQRNPTFSLRAYARYLAVDQSYLSKVLKGDRQFSSGERLRISERLQVSPAEAERLLDVQPTSNLSEDQFRLISDWIHFAILELIKTKNFVPTTESMAKRLGVHTEEIKDALDRLQFLGFVSIQKEKITLLRPANTWFNSSKTNEARRLLQRKYAEMSLQALDMVDFSERDHGSLCLAIDKAKIPMLKEYLNEVRQHLAIKFQDENPENLDEVYQITMSFFPLTKKSKI
jgi:DNA-binding transcriptional regulator YhcF (GntR family)